MKIALVCDWLVTYAGAERVLEQIIQCFPNADLFAVVDFLPEDQRGFLNNKQAVTTFIQKFPFAKKHYRTYLPWMTVAIEQLDLSQYDLVISSSHAVAKGILTGPDQVHISYVHSPMRYAWDMQHQYLKESGLTQGFKSAIARYLLHKLRLWDYRTSNGVDHFIANSDFIARRILKTYRREADVIYPPVDIQRFTPYSDKNDFYLTASRLVPYKKIDFIVESFAHMPDKKLIVIGDGPDFAKIKAKAGKNVELLGYQPTEKLIEYMQRAKAFVFAAEEDFGIIPLEAQASGTPVVAYGKGGVRETIRGLDQVDPTGVFFEEQTVSALCKAIDTLDNNYEKITQTAIKENVQRFAPDIFREKFSQLVLQKFQEKSHQARR